MSDGITLVAPIAGWLTPLDEVPDPVFAERMMGEGIAIDPTEAVLRAPADATVIGIPETAHAVTLRLRNGAEILIHVGLETVALGGKGFRAVSAAGRAVKAGDPLIEIDLAQVASAATSLVTPIVCASEGYAFVPAMASRKVARGEAIGTVSGGEGVASSEGVGETREREVTLTAAHGLHARPAARIAALLRPFTAEVSLVVDGRTANARSTVAMLGLGARQGGRLRILARGPERQAAADAVAALIESGMGETRDTSAPPVIASRTGPVCASPGLAIGRAIQFRLPDLPVPRDGNGASAEREQLRNAIARASSSLADTRGLASELAAAHRELLDDPDLLAHADRQIAQGRSAAFAWRSACQDARARIAATDNPLVAERAADLADIERQVIATLLGDTAPALPELPAESILIAPDLLPSQLLGIDKSRLAGIATVGGGATSHVAIIAASSGVPMIAGCGPSVLDIGDGASVILDADHATIEADPSPERLTEAQQRVAERRERRAAEARDAHELCFTADGLRIEVFANLGSVDDARIAVAAGAEGCGLLRTEFLFLHRDTPPTRDEQQGVYADIAAALDGRPLVVRTLDIGADKTVPYLNLGREENPALGLRGIRLSLAQPELLATQLDAILAAVPADQCRIMLPMITEVDELRQSRDMLDAAAERLGVTARVPLGVMIETPAAAVLAESIAAQADFLSVGTNDLTQYALAADRGNAAVASRADALHPAVLRLIGQAASGARAHDRWIGVCGGLASDPLAAAILIGLGITELSVAPAAVPAIKAAVRRLRMDDCRALAKRACDAASADEVRAIAAEAAS